MFGVNESGSFTNTVFVVNDAVLKPRRSLQHTCCSRFDMSVFRVLVAIEDLIMTKKMIQLLLNKTL